MCDEGKQLELDLHMIDENEGRNDENKGPQVAKLESSYQVEEDDRVIKLKPRTSEENDWHTLQKLKANIESSEVPLVHEDYKPTLRLMADEVWECVKLQNNPTQENLDLSKKKLTTIVALLQKRFS